jgi:hypothetical protein
MTPRFPTSTHLQRLLFTALVLAAAVSLSIGCRGALRSSKDLQWGGANLLLHHIDPYAEALAGSPHHLANFSPPNYLPEFYLLLLPLAALSFHHAAALWCLLSVLLSIASMYLLRQIFALTRNQAVAILLLLWCGVPFRTMLQVGQVSTLELFLFCLVFRGLNLRRTAPRSAGAPTALALGLTAAKYSFSPVALGWFLFRARYRLLVLSLLAPFAGLLIACAMLRASLSRLAVEPLIVSRTSVWPGLADLMTATELALHRLGLSTTLTAASAYAAALAVALLFSFLLRRHTLSTAAEFTLIALASLFTFKHLVYDYVFLLVPICYAVSARGRALRKPVAAAIAFFWFAVSLLPHLPRAPEPTTAQAGGFLLTFAVFAAFLIYLTRRILRLEAPQNALENRIKQPKHVLVTVI